jgi:hypothetical protein
MQLAKFRSFQKSRAEGACIVIWGPYFYNALECRAWIENGVALALAIFRTLGSRVTVANYKEVLANLND